MRVKIKQLKLDAGRPVAFLNETTAKKLHLHIGERVQISNDGQKIIAIADIVKDFLKKDEVSLSEEITDYLKVKPGEYVEVDFVLPPVSTQFILKKLAGKSLSREEIFQIIKDISSNLLTEAEIAYFVSGNYEHGMSMKETFYLTEAMYKTGINLHWRTKEIVDKHSIGGIAGNRTTPIVVSICSAAGIIMPKTSSRAITSASGTADVMETITKVDFSAKDLQKIVKKTNACLAWGGSLGLAPSDDKLIRVERLLNLDPESQLIASILSKKLSVGSKYVLIDIPYGKNAKVDKKRALNLKKKFIEVGKHFGLKIEVILTKGDEPIGNGIGPILEIKDVLRVLRRDAPHPEDLEEKSILLAGIILEMTGKASKGLGKLLAREILESGQAYKKFEEIISAQGKKDRELRPARYSRDIKSSRSGKIKEINNKEINLLGRVLGCPSDDSAGIYLYKHCKERVKKGEMLMTFYAESPKKLREALDLYNKSKAVKIN